MRSFQTPSFKLSAYCLFPFKNFTLTFNFVCVLLSKCGHINMSTAPGDALAPLKLELLVVVNGLMWELNLDSLQEQYTFFF